MLSRSQLTSVQGMNSEWDLTYIIDGMADKLVLRPRSSCCQG